MLEDGGETNEERLEVTREGEAPGRISLDLARALVLPYAGRTRDFYGGPYTEQDTIRRVLRTKWREGRYDLLLPYWFARNFMARPGIAGFTSTRRAPCGFARYRGGK